MKYLVTEIQVFADGSTQAPTWAYSDENSASAKYHQVLAAAAVSQVPEHSAIMYTSKGFCMKGECFEH